MPDITCLHQKENTTLLSTGPVSVGPDYLGEAS